jgi:hypothetical protein
MEGREKLSFLEMFIAKFGPRNFAEMKEALVRKGKYRGYPFTVIETRCNYAVTFLDKSRFFTSGYNAVRWIERLGDEQARRDRPSQLGEMVQSPASGVEMPANASELW